MDQSRRALLQWRAPVVFPSVEKSVDTNPELLGHLLQERGKVKEGGLQGNKKENVIQQVVGKKKEKTS